MSWRLQVTGEESNYSVYLHELNEFTVYDGAGGPVADGYVNKEHGPVFLSNMMGMDENLVAEALKEVFEED